MGKKNRNAINKRQQARKAEHAQKRKSVAPNGPEPQKKPQVSATDIIKGFTGDVFSILQHKAGMQMLLNSRLKFAEELVERDPLKFNELRVDSFRKIKEHFDNLNEKLKGLMGVAGKLEDIPTTEEKMMYIADKFDAVAEVYYEFDMIQQEMQRADMQFNQSVQKATGLDPSKRPTVEYIETYGDDDFNIKTPTVVHALPGEIISLPGEIMGKDVEGAGAMRIAIAPCGVDFKKRNPDNMNEWIPASDNTGPIVLEGNIAMLRFQWGNYAFVMPEQEMSYVIGGFNREGVTVKLISTKQEEPEEAPMPDETKPNVHEDQDVQLSPEEAQQIINDQQAPEGTAQ